jgi:hypothetical protein
VPFTLCGARALLSLLVLTFAAHAAGAQITVRQIAIHSAWGGLGTPQNEDVVILPKNGVFAYKGKRLDTSQIQALVAALQSPAVPRPDPANLGATPAWLDEQVASRNPRSRAQAGKTTPRQQALFTTTFRDPQTIARVLLELFSFVRTDDYPFARVEVILGDGSKLAAETHSYYPFMLPWAIEGSGAQTFNADISRALSRLLPRKAPNKERLAGSDFAAELVGTVMRSIETRWKLLGSEDRAGDALTSLRQSYEVIASEINPYHHPEYGTATYKGEPQEMNLHATLRKAAFPPNISDALVLRQVQEKVEGVDAFLKAAGQYEDLVLSVAWLNDYIRDHPRVPVRISYVHNLSFGDKAMRTFAADMKVRERPDLTEQVQAKQADIGLLIVGNTYSESYWLLFPDKHMMLWRYGGPSGLLKWTPAEFPPGQCSEYQENFGGCSGREVTPDGTLLAEHAPRDQVCMAANRTTPSPASESANLFPVEDRGRGGFIDRTGKVVIPLCFDAVGDFSDGLARFERDKKWGYIDATGAIMIEPTFPWAQEFSDGLAYVQVSGTQLGPNARWGFIDKTGRVVIQPKYRPLPGGNNNIGSDSPENGFHDGHAKIQIDGKTGYIDKTGEIIIPPEFTYAYPFSEGLAAVTKSSSGNDGWGYIDKTGKWVIAPQFEWASSFQEGLAPVNRKHDCGYIDVSGAFVLRPPLSPGETDCATVWGDFVNGLSRWKFGRKYGYLDRSGKVVIKARFDLTFHFSEGLAAVMIGGKWGYIDTSGKVVVEPRALARAEDFHNGLAFVSTKDGKYGYIDRTGKYVWTPTPLSAKLNLALKYNFAT